MRYLSTLLLLVACSQTHAQALQKPAAPQQGQDIMGKAMVVSRIAGLCEGLKQVQVFQKSAQLEGGDEFAQRFLAAEAKRLNKTLAQLDTQCNQAESTYRQLARMAGVENN
ncbi:hypothetical protein EY643_00585 [Halioglobus maricola]|uniref:Uncharacterized protein n=1 Tax=Halioglobus maricola TaxID=2601894 RepID=A0A5P9NEV8_9GAMM|nr:hypothetical protein EY643_00585 [Halioglobus maricola]